MKKLYSLLLAVLIAAYVLPLSSLAAIFPDVKDEHSASVEIKYLVEQGIIIEKPNQKYRVNEPITRLEASAMIQRALKLSMENRPAVELSDVKSSHPHYQLIATMVDEGIFMGNANQEFLPNGNLKRGQMAAVFVRAFDLKGTSGYRFRDVPASYWALPAIQTLSAQSVTTGFLDNTFKPNDSLTRGHFAVFLARILEPSFKNTPACYIGDNKAQQVVTVPVSTLWKQPGTKRPVDSYANGKTPDISKWVSSMTLPQKQWLVGKLETQVLYGQTVKVLQTKGDWAQVAVVDQSSPKHAAGYPGWLPKNHLATVYPNYSTCKTAMLKTKTAILTHDENGKKPFRTISFNTTLPVVGETGDRIAVQTPTDGVKYINKNTVKLVNAKESLPNPTAQQIVETAKIFDGLSYLWAGTSGFGLDCSGFTYSVYRQHGINLPRDASVQAVNGMKVLKKDLQPGDLLFFAYNKGKGTVHHVGMYIGNGQMIHAPNPKRTVEIVPLTLEPYKSEYAGARRYLR
ncbi:S-layer homology domain-containing protein [Sporosarcina newyorkensis]|uniref:Cell wall-associated hydrolases (Invasion-associated proteins) n=1 Tax=Sporosarcina newyorkensis TaxID=759851 RepID=A0A1T4YKY0_9BACL|nr:S-layer homology domain-containing protein [Sporosarcina newyorkensis]SKB02416.1 Cell wall-associated hydrolases (invasion-associated proteins) [Sporosarcina newyorkensis]